MIRSGSSIGHDDPTATVRDESKVARIATTIEVFSDRILDNGFGFLTRFA